MDAARLAAQCRWLRHPRRLVEARRRRRLAVLNAGASGYRHSHAPSTPCVQALDVIAGGELWVAPYCRDCCASVDSRLPCAGVADWSQPAHRTRAGSRPTGRQRRQQPRHRHRPWHHRTHRQGPPQGRVRKAAGRRPPAAGLRVHGCAERPTGADFGPSHPLPDLRLPVASA